MGGGTGGGGGGEPGHRVSLECQILTLTGRCTHWALHRKNKTKVGVAPPPGGVVSPPVLRCSFDVL